LFNHYSRATYRDHGELQTVRFLSAVCAFRLASETSAFCHRFFPIICRMVGDGSCGMCRKKFRCRRGHGQSTYLAPRCPADIITSSSITRRCGSWPGGGWALGRAPLLTAHTHHGFRQDAIARVLFLFADSNIANFTSASFLPLTKCRIATATHAVAQAT
jgi:hypothetical protein